MQINMQKIKKYYRTLMCSELTPVQIISYTLLCLIALCWFLMLNSCTTAKVEHKDTAKVCKDTVYKERLETDSEGFVFDLNTFRK